MKVFIWGTGAKLDNVLAVIGSDIEIIGFIDNDERRQHYIIDGKEVFSPNVLYHQNFDYVIISASMNYKEISKQMEKMGINKQKIVQYYNYTRFFPKTSFYNNLVVNDDRYNLLFENYVDSRIGRNIVFKREQAIYDQLVKYYDEKKSFREGRRLKVLEVAYLFYAGACIYDSSKYTFEYMLLDFRKDGEYLLKQIYNFKPDIIMTQDSTFSIRKIFDHKNILYLNINDNSPFLYLMKSKNCPPNEIGLFFQTKSITQAICNNEVSKHIVHWEYVEDATFLDCNIEVADEFQTDILIAGTSNSSFYMTKQYIRNAMVPSWMIGNDLEKNDFLNVLDMMMDELYYRMDVTGVLIEDEKVYTDIFYEIVRENNFNLDFLNEIPKEDIDFFHHLLKTLLGYSVFRFLIVKWIIDSGYQVELWGSAWKGEEITKDYYKGIIEDREELKKAYNKAKICLFTNPELSFHFSVFEMIGSKSLCLAYENKRTSCTTLLSDYFEDGKSIALYHNREELFEKIDYYLNNLQYRRQVIEAGNRIMIENNICWENELSKAVHQAVKQAKQNGMYQ